MHRSTGRRRPAPHGPPARIAQPLSGLLHRLTVRRTQFDGDCQETMPPCVGEREAHGWLLWPLSSKRSSAAFIPARAFQALGNPAYTATWRSTSRISCSMQVRIELLEIRPAALDVLSTQIARR